MTGAADPLYVGARRALLDALEALDAHRLGVIVVGAQAVYVRTQRIDVAIAEMTTDGDLALDPRALGAKPLLEDALTRAGFAPNAASGNPGAWLSRDGVEVDLMVPAALAGGTGRRSVQMPPHSRTAARRTEGLEAALVDHGELELGALDVADQRTIRALVAGPAALVVAKAHKIRDRLRDGRAGDRRADKDAHDVYRLLRSTDTPTLASTFGHLLADEIAGDATRAALEVLAEHFATGPSSEGARMAGRAEHGVGQPETVSASVSVLAADRIDVIADPAG